MKVISDDDIKDMLAFAEDLIPLLKGRILAPGDRPQITFSFPKYTEEEENFYFWRGNK